MAESTNWRWYRKSVQSNEEQHKDQSYNEDFPTLNEEKTTKSKGNTKSGKKGKQSAMTLLSNQGLRGTHSGRQIEKTQQQVGDFSDLKLRSPLFERKDFEVMPKTRSEENITQNMTKNYDCQKPFTPQRRPNMQTHFPNFQFRSIGRGGFGVRPEMRSEDISRPKGTIDKKKITLGFPFLKALLGKDPSFIVIELTKNKVSLQECIERAAIEEDFLELFLKVLAEAYMSKSTPKQLLGLFESLKQANFFNTVVMFLIDMSAKITEGLVDFDKCELVIKNLLSVVMAQLQRNPSALIAFTRIHTTLNQVVDGLGRVRKIDESICEALCQFKELKKISEKEERPKGSGQRPPDDFRAYPISPCKDELLRSGRPFLRTNKIEGQYNDLDHYLDVQYRLLREDFVGPLRQGLIEYLDSKHAKGVRIKDPKKQQKNIKLYKNVIIQSPIMSEHGLCYSLQLDVTPAFRRTNWSQSKRLIYGSLVCLTDVDFTDLYVATIVDNDNIKNGMLIVHFEKDSISTEDVLHKTFTMVESSAYYESYKHVLAGMQCIEPGDLPFENNILGKVIDVARPSYLSETAEFDMRPLVDQNYVITPTSRLRRSFEEFPQHTFTEKSDPAKSVCVSQFYTWPDKELLNLDESQYKAIHSALTKEFAIVQGPPGTGKTYIGLQIAKLLLHNKSIWAGTRESSQPMLIVCYTNHALDQFLEGILNFFKGDILRIGGRSKSDKLYSYNLREIRKRRHEPHTPIGMAQLNKVQAKEVLNQKLREMSVFTRAFEIYRSELLHERALQEVMGRHYHSLINWGPGNVRNQQKHQPYMYRWLGIANIEHECGQEAEQRYRSDNEQKKEINEETLRRRHANIKTSEEFSYGLSDQEVNTIRAKNVAFHAYTYAEPYQYADKKKTIAIDTIYRLILRSKLARNTSSPDIMSDEEASQTRQVWRLAPQQRWRLYRLWVQTFCVKESKIIDDMKSEFEELSERYQEALKQEDIEIMKQASVIGMTTTGAAKYQAVLKEVGPSIVIVEEAAEVLEAHIVMSLSKSCKHVILIGDHKQLRPNTNVYHLAKKYNLDISLFERMVKAGMEYSCLRSQHRMRPEIASIVRHIYPQLEDHENVKNYPNVKGISTNLHLISHNEQESTDGDEKSYSNWHEARYAVALCQYLLLQGYQKSQITILTTYSAQLFLIKNQLPRSEERNDNVNVTVVDNYQGEENDIVILSLVRSNKLDRIGFLKIENRICVALSRAKIGFYIIGNFDHLAAHSQLWEDITDDMRRKGQLSPGLKLFCQNHPDDNGIVASCPNDFDNAPEGGCTKMCDARLKCGHTCEKHCHILDPTHDIYRCMKPCIKKCKNAGHPCKAKCFMVCPPCDVILTKTMSKCQHEQDMSCGTDPKDFICSIPCETMLDCDHPCTNKCGESHTTKCEVMIEYTGRCGHTSERACWNKKKKCPYPCDSVLQCGHKCTGTCGTCYNDRIHELCQNKCTRTLVCGHECSGYCDICLPCKEPCRNRCVHSKCQLRCGESCTVCTEPCPWKCDHYQCSKLCHEVCDRPKCNMPCPKKIAPCNHDCIGLCGEPCPAVCRICDETEVTEIFFGEEDNPDARFVLLEDCSHFIEYKAMDRFMSMGDDGESIKLKCCPKCSTPIQKSLRYGDIINDVLANIERVKIAVKGDKDHMDSLRSQIAELTTSKVGYGGLSLNERYYDIVKLSKTPLISEHQLISLINYIKIREALDDIEKRKSSCPYYTLSKKLVFLQQMMLISMEPSDGLTEQRLNDLMLELKRMRTILRFGSVLKN